MKEVKSLTRPERVFLSGCIKNMILANGAFDEGELDELEIILEELEFDDYEDRLIEFENEVADNEGFWELAETIDNQETQELILEVLYDLSIQKGLEESTEKKFISRLKKLWQI